MPLLVQLLCLCRSRLAATAAAAAAASWKVLQLFVVHNKRPCMAWSLQHQDGLLGLS